MNNNKSYRVAKKIVEILKANEGQKVKYRCGFKNKLIDFIYYLKVIFYFKSYY